MATSAKFYEQPSSLGYLLDVVSADLRDVMEHNSNPPDMIVEYIQSQ